MGEPPPSFESSAPLTAPERGVANLLVNNYATLPPPKERRRAWIALRILVWSPALLTVFMYFVTPTYFRPMLENSIGLVLLGILVGALGVSFGLVEAGIWLLRRSRVVPGIVALVGYLVSWLVAVWIVVLGPAALILLAPRS